jgi:hypothetical protein
LCKAFAVGAIDGDVAESGSAVVLDIGVGRGKEVDEDGNSASVDKLLSVIICMTS